MRTLRFFHETLDSGTLELSRDESHHAQNVLRVSAGQPVELFDGRGRIAHATVQGHSGHHVQVTVEDIQEVSRPEGIRLTLLTALPRSPRQAFLFEKVTELGVDRIIPVRFDRSTVNPRPGAVAKWRRTCIEAAKQCGCAYLPQIGDPTTLDNSLARADTGDTRWAASPQESARHLLDELRDMTDAQGLSVWVGPEGGFASREYQLFQDRGVLPVRLGPHMLRIETADMLIAAACLLTRKPREASQ